MRYVRATIMDCYRRCDTFLSQQRPSHCSYRRKVYPFLRSSFLTFHRALQRAYRLLVQGPGHRLVPAAVLNAKSLYFAEGCLYYASCYNCIPPLLPLLYLVYPLPALPAFCAPRNGSGNSILNAAPSPVTAPLL